MYFYSTRDNEKRKFSASEALLKGLADDGGLFVPSSYPKLNADINLSYPAFAYECLKPFFEGDELLSDLKGICEKAFNFPIILNRIERQEVLELFHGPTSAFKDFGARFLASSMETLLKSKGNELCILVATSGDTGGAVASAFHGKAQLSVKVLFPKGRVAERQKRQLTCWDGNVSSYEVDGAFDDCQRMVKEAFMDKSLKGLSSANSINLGRLLPQMVYYVWASNKYLEKYGKKPTVIVPSGNVGNCTGAYWAKLCSAPISQIVLAVNANTTIPDYLKDGVYKPRPSVKTLANAMDVGAPSNMERLFNIFPTYEEMKENVSAFSVSDDLIREEIKNTYKEEGYIICPHTACGKYVADTYFKDECPIIVSTAHPAKFESVVEPLIGERVPLPPSLNALVTAKSNYKSIAADYKLLF